MRLAIRPTPDPIDPARPTLVLLHGITGSQRTWWRFAPALAAAGWQVLAMDLRCHGASDCDGPIGRWDAADDVVETIVAELGRPHVDVLWGHSLGARTALQALVRHPGLADRAILEDPPGIIGNRGEEIVNWRREAALARTDPGAYADEMRADHPTWDERDVAAVVADVATTRLEPLITAIEAGAAMNDPAHELVRRARIPILLVVPPPEQSVLGEVYDATIAGLPPGSRAVRLDGGHTLHRDRPDEYLAAALEWLAG